MCFVYFLTYLSNFTDRKFYCLIIFLIPTNHTHSCGHFALLMSFWFAVLSFFTILFNDEKFMFLNFHAFSIYFLENFFKSNIFSCFLFLLLIPMDGRIDYAIQLFFLFIASHFMYQLSLAELSFLAIFRPIFTCFVWM